jgi:hypothetical protein
VGWIKTQISRSVSGLWRALFRRLRPNPVEPRQPPHHILFVGREAAIAAAKPIMDVAGPLLRDCVNEGARVFLAVQEGTKSLPADVAIAPLRLFHKVLESADAAELLLSAGAVRAATGPARSCFEACAELMFMHQLGTRFAEASLTWYATKLKREQAFFERARDLDADDAKLVEATNERIDRVKKLLAMPHIAAVSPKAKRPWYRSFDNSREIASLEDLVELLDRAIDPTGKDKTFRRAYAFIFVPYSESAHASDHRAFYEITEGRVLLRPIRQPEDVQQIASTTASMTLGAIRTIAARLRPEVLDELTAWYVRKVQKPYHWLRPD